MVLVSSHHKTTTTTTADQNLTINQTPAEKTHPLHNVIIRSSPQSNKHALMSHSRSNSLGNARRSSRAGSRHGSVNMAQASQSDAPFLLGGEFDLANWDLNDPMFAGFFDSVGPMNSFAGNDLADNFQATECSNYQPVQANGLQPAFDFSASNGHPIQPYTQSAAVPVPDFTDKYDWPPIDPALPATPGLAAIPSVPVDFVNQHMPMYPDPEFADYMPQPYYSYQPIEQSGYTPVDQHVTGVAGDDHQDNAHKIQDNAVRKQQKRARDDSDEEPVRKRVRRVTHVVEDSSDDESYIKVSAKKARKVERSYHETSGDEASSLGNFKVKKPAIANAGQKPEKMEDKPWVRINTNTKGETSRTARINVEAKELRKYKAKPLPNGEWQSGKYKFEYTAHGGLDEFKKKRMSARQIQEYIMNYPSDDLRLWLQVAPADMARRYGSPGHSKCLFENCPKHIWGDSGTIDVGHYRIAFDEKFKTYGNKVVDPFDCPGFVHLYCLERFLDFEAICQVADIQVDTRVDLPRETGQAKWSMSGRPEADLAQYFLKAAKKRSSVRATEPFKHYPVHVSSTTPKQFDNTLVHALAEANLQARSRSQIRQFVERKITPNVLMINKGDLEIAMTQKKIRTTSAYKKALKFKRCTATTYNYDAFYDEYDPIINERIAEYEALKARFDAEDAAGVVSRRKKRGTATKERKAKVPEADSSDDELNFDAESDFEDMADWQPPARGSRTSSRNKPQVNYAEDETTPPFQAEYQGQGFQEVSKQPRRRSSCTNLFPKTFLGAEPLSLDAYAAEQAQPAGELTQEEIAAVINKYNTEYKRRRSSSSGSRKPRQASFNAQPVSASAEFDINDPPSALVATPSDLGRRSSARFASKA